MKQLVCLAAHAWSAVPDRTQQLMSRMKDVQILYFSPARGLSDLSFRRGGKKVRPNVTAWVLPPPLFPPEERYGHLFRSDRRRISRFITQQCTRMRVERPLLWTTSPLQVHLLDQLEYSALVYDCRREWPDFPDVWEGSLAQAADLVLAASPELRDRLSPCSANIALLPNGVNYPLFSRQHARPGAVPTFGWAGALHADLDLSPVLYTARRNPQWRFLLVGRREDNPLLPRLANLPNVAMPGACSPLEVPELLSRCHVLLELLRSSRPYSDVVSSRLYEYLAMGKPVVSMLWPDQVEPFPDVVYGASSCQEFARMCQHALEEHNLWAAQRRRHYGQQASWSARAGAVRRILDTAGLL